MSVKNTHITEQESTEGNDLPDGKVGEIISWYEQSLVFPKTKPSKQFLLCPIGLVGAGKTTVVKPLSKKLNLLRISTDEIRLLLREKGYNYLRTKEIAYTIVKNYLGKGYSIAIDADCVSPETQQHIKRLREKYRLEIIWIHINPLHTFIEQKLRTYPYTSEGLFKNAQVGIENYKRRKSLHKNINFPFTYTFNTSQPDLQSQIDEAVKEIRKKID